MMMHQYDAALDRARLIVEAADASSVLDEYQMALARAAYQVLPEVIAAERDVLLDTPGADLRQRQAQDRLQTLYRTHWSNREAFERDLAGIRATEGQP